MSVEVKLSEKQRAIVFAESGPIYVKASAGSGKTRVLTERVRYLLTQTSKKILTLTFTNKAGEEIRERLSGIVDIEKCTFIGTFHSFCQSIMENHGSLIGYTKMPHIFEDEADRLELIEQSINQTPSYAASFKRLEKKSQKSFCYDALSFISDVKRKLISENEIANHTDNENYVLLYRNYQDILRAQNAIDFDDLLLCSYKLLSDFPKIADLYRRSFFAICIDEAQDLNNAQYQFLRILAGSEFDNVMMVGDPNQSIFHFNGSSADYMDKYFRAHFKPKVDELIENYRSSTAILEAAKKIIPEADYIEGTVTPGIFKLFCLKDEYLEAKWIASKVLELVSLSHHDDIEGPINFEKIAVLARNGYLFNALASEFKEKNVPFYYKMSPGAVKFESSIMQIFDLALRLKLNPKDTLHLQRLLALLSIKTDTEPDLSAIANMPIDQDFKKMLDLVISLKENGSNLQNAIIDYKNRLTTQDENEKSMIFNDVDELVKHWHNYARKNDSKSLHQFKNAMALGQTHSLSQHTGVTLSTVHTMKGQEFEIVFLIGMDDETFPDYRAVNKGGVEMTNEKNNLYVAFTRSKRWLYVTWPKHRTMPWGAIRQRKVSRFLSEFECVEIPEPAPSV